MPSTGDGFALIIGMAALGYLIWTLMFPERL